jgi:hypothetical protein
MEPWARETERYRKRALELGYSLNDLADEIKKLPRAPLSARLSDKAAIQFQVCLLTIGIFRSAQQLASSLQLLWPSGQFVTASLTTRLLVELQGVLAYADRKVLRKLDDPNNIEICHTRMVKLLLGSKSGVLSLQGDSRDARPVVNVMDFIKEGEGAFPGLSDTYSFLCDGSHPTYLQHSYLLFAGPNYDNWTNEALAVEAHRTLERTLSAAEGALAGIRSTGLAIFAECLSLILSETSGLLKNGTRGQ